MDTSKLIKNVSRFAEMNMGYYQNYIRGQDV